MRKFGDRANRMFSGRMRRRRGVSLLIVLAFCVTAALIAGQIFLSFQWAQLSTVAEERRFRDRLTLSSLAAEGGRWLRARVRAGYLPSGGARTAPTRFSDVRLLRLERGSAVLDVYDLDYDPRRLLDEDWLSAHGAERFFPPGQGAYLLRAFKSEDKGVGIMLEVVLSLGVAEGDSSGRPLLDEKPLLWQEVWP